METFSTLLAIYAGNSPVPGEFPTQKPVTQSFDVFFDLRLNKRLSKQSWGWWFEMLSCPLWRHHNEPGDKLDQRDIAAKFVVIRCMVLDSLYRADKQFLFLLIFTSATTLSQSQRNVIQYIFPDLYFIGRIP